MVRCERHEWLAKRAESAIDPQQRIVDPHHHLWDRAGSTYLATELITDTTHSHNVTHTVFVECSSNYDQALPPGLAPIGETRFVAAQADRAKQIGGVDIAAIVGHANLSMGSAVEDVIAAHDEAGRGLFRGIRHGTNWSSHADIKNGHHDPTPRLLADSGFRSGVSTLGQMGFLFEAWLYFDQLCELADLARAVPECQIVIDHLGGPLGIGPHANSRPEMIREWRRGIGLAAANDNTVLKIGGLGMEHYFGTQWADLERPPSSQQVAAHWADLVHFAIDAFGPSRCMFESNFPVDRQTVPYSVLWNAFQILGAEYSASEQDELFAGTAWRTYDLER